MSEKEEDEFKGKVCTFKKPTFKKRGQAKGQIRSKRPREDEGQGGSEGSEEEEESVLLSRSDKKSRGSGGLASSGAMSKLDDVSGVFTSDRTAVPVAVAGGATYTLEIDTEHDRDQRAMLELNIAAQQDGVTNDDTKIYRGQAFYKNYIPKDAAQIGGNKYTGTQGPIRAPTYLRATAVFDYKPDICKDYKETGWCGFGDSCKFIHDRGDYKSGYELEREWDEEQKRKKLREEGGLLGNDDDGEEDYFVGDEDDELPFACFICREPFTDPVVTVCGHYFCQQCALDHNKTDPTCPACGEKTGGVFNVARKLLVKHKKEEEKRKQKKAVKKAASSGQEDEVAEEGEEGEEEEEEEELGLTTTVDKGVKKGKVGSWS